MKSFKALTYYLLSSVALVKACPFNKDDPHSPCATTSNCLVKGLYSTDCVSEIRSFCCNSFGAATASPQGCHQFQKVGACRDFKRHEIRKRKLSTGSGSSGGTSGASGGEEEEEATTTTTTVAPPTTTTITTTTTSTTFTPSPPKFCDIDGVYIVDLTESKNGKAKKWRDIKVVRDLSSESAIGGSSSTITITIDPDHDYTMVTSLYWQLGDPLLTKMKKGKRGFDKNVEKSVVAYTVSGYEMSMSKSPYAINGMKKKNRFLPLEIETCRLYSIEITSFPEVKGKGKSKDEEEMVTPCDNFIVNLILERDDQDC